MSRNTQFGSTELCKVLKGLGFVKKKSVGSSHEKWSVPKNTRLNPGQRPFIIVVKNKKTYLLPTCKGYIREIRALGFMIDL